MNNKYTLNDNIQQRNNYNHNRNNQQLVINDKFTKIVCFFFCLHFICFICFYCPLGDSNIIYTGKIRLFTN